MIVAGRVGKVRHALTVEVRHEHDTIGAGRGLERQVVEPVVVDAEQAGDRIGHFGRVERAHEREEATGRVGEPGDRAGRIPSRCVAHREHGARRSDRDDDVTRARADAERGGHVVAGTRRDRNLAVTERVGGAGGLARAEHTRDPRLPVEVAVDDPQQIEPVPVFCRVEVAGTRTRHHDR